MPIRYASIPLSMRLFPSSVCLVLTLILLGGCDFLGSKDDSITDEILRDGRIDPTQVSDVGYVPIQPFFQETQGGTLDRPTDIAAGFDEFLYVVDRVGVHVIDRAGRPQFAMTEFAGQPLIEAVSVVQDRRFRVHVAAMRDTTLVFERDGMPDERVTYRLPVVYQIDGLTAGSPSIVDILWHPFDDRSRQLRVPIPQPFDEQTRFTGLAVRPDNSLLVTRAGPLVNVQLSVLLSTVLVFDRSGVNTNALTSLNARRGSLVSSVYPTAIATAVGPPQRTTFPDSRDFFIAQSRSAPVGGSADIDVPFGVLSIRVTDTPDGRVYEPDVNLLAAAQLGEPGQRFLYEANRFGVPSGITIAADQTSYLFVTDSARDSLFVFTPGGVEGVAPPPGSTSLLPVNVSFGGSGSGLLQLDSPSGVAYFDRTVYVADTGNNRITRYRLNTDLE